MRAVRRLLPVVCWICAAAAQPTDLGPADREFIETHFRAAKSAESVQEFAKAAEEYKLILARFPTALPRVHHNLGLALYFDRKCEAALSSLRAAAQLEAGVAATHLVMGMSHMCLGDPGKALPEFQLAHRLEATSETAVQLGMAHSMLNHPRQAVRFFRAGLEGGADNETALYLLGDEYMRLAKGAAETLIARHPDTAWEHLVIARIFDSQQFYHVGAQAYLKAVKKDPWNAASLLRLARLLAILGRKEASELALDRVRQLAPDQPAEPLVDDAVGVQPVEAAGGGSTNFEEEIRGLRAVDPAARPLVPLLPSSVNELLRKRIASDRTGKWNAAAQQLGSARRQESTRLPQGLAAGGADWLPGYLGATVSLWRDDPDGAERTLNSEPLATASDPAVQMLRWEAFERLGRHYYQRLLDEHPNSARARFVRARILDAQEKTEAVAEYQAAIDANPRQPGIRLALADNYMINARLAEALDLCRRELEVDPPSIDARACIGRIHVDLRQPDQALPYLRESLKARPGDASLHSALGRAYELKNQLDQAVAAYQRALALDPSQNKLHYLLSNVYRRQGRMDLAEKESALFQRAGMAEREQHIQFVQRYYRGGQTAAEPANPRGR